MDFLGGEQLSDLKGKCALVTGASRGLGAEIVRELARAGASVSFTYSKDSDSAKCLANEVGAREIVADVRDFDRAHEVVESLSGIDILVCNAGAARGGAFYKLSEDDWDSVLEISLKGAFNYMHAVAPAFIEQKSGKIVCVGSINGLRGRMGTASYNAAKAGLVGLVKTAASELGPYNVNVNLVAPGYIDSPSQEKTPELIKDLVIKECAIKRLGTAADIAPVVAFLCSEGARHITGQTIKVDAGQYL